VKNQQYSIAKTVRKNGNSEVNSSMNTLQITLFYLSNYTLKIYKRFQGVSKIGQLSKLIFILLTVSN